MKKIRTSLLSIALLCFSQSGNAITPSAVTASGHDGNIPANTLDSDPSFSTRWSANGNDGSQWIRYDFGNAQALSALQIAFYKGDQRSSYFEIQSSDNGSSWQSQGGPRTSAGNTLANETFAFSQNVTARYFRILGYGNSSNTWNSITDVKFVAATDGAIHSVPGLIQAEDYADYSDTTAGNAGSQYRNDDVDVQITSDSGGGYNVGWTANGEWLEYPINVTTAGNYTADVRVASARNDAGGFQLLIDGTPAGAYVDLNNTGGWQQWITKSVDLGSLSAGTHTLRINISGGHFNINWLQLSSPSNSTVAPGQNFDLSDWYLSVPTDTDNNGKADSIKGETMATYEDPNFFYTAADGGMVFECPIDGYKTSSGTKYTRVELREMVAGTTDTKDLKNQWAFSSTPTSFQQQVGAVDGVLRATLAVNHVTTTGNASQRGRVIIGQIHAPDDEPIRLYYHKTPNNELGALYFAHEPESATGLDEEYIYLYGDSRSSSMPNPVDGIALNEVFTYEITVVGNLLSVTIIRDGYADKTETYNMANSGYDVDGQYMYFKAGVYNQNDSGDADDYVKATFYSLENSHSSYNLN